MMSRIITVCLFVLGVLLLTTGELTAQDRGAPDRDRLGPHLRSLFPEDVGTKAGDANVDHGTLEPLPRDPASVTSKARETEAAETRYGIVVYTKKPQVLRDAGIEPNSTSSSFATARLTRDEISAASRLSDVDGVRYAGTATAHNDVAAGLTGVRVLNNGGLNNVSYTGSGVLACVIDTGIDWSHRDVRGLGSNDNQSRIRYLWDQTLTAQSGEQAPSGRRSFSSGTYDYGVEYTRTDIEDEIDGSPANYVRSKDTEGHGTHVAATVAGNGGAHSQQKFKGMAPDADLIVVKAGNGSFPLSNVVDGMNYCGEVADQAGMPVVVNMSLGTGYGPHDGTSFQDQAVESFTSGTNGRAVVVSAGNDGNAPIHTQGTISASGGTGTVTVNLPNSVTQGDFKVNFWMNDASDVSVSVTSPNGETASQSAGGTSTTGTTDGEIYLANTTDASLGGGDREIVVDVSDGNGNAPAQGNWSITFTNNTSSSVSFHGWLYDRSLDGVKTSIDGGDGTYTIGSPGSSAGAITVGASVHRWRWKSTDGNIYSYSSSERSDDIASFSSRGPLRESSAGVQKPNLTAPGQGMGSALSSDASVATSRILPSDKHWLTQGTSMAAPTVAGATALLLQESASLSPGEIKDVLESTAREDGYTGSGPDATWGYGRLDAVRAMTKVIDPGGSASREVIAYDDWGSDSGTTVQGDEKIAVQFTPSFDGVVSGFLLHPWAPVGLSGNFHVEIWSDDGSGHPDQLLGTQQTFDYQRLHPYSWNYFDIADAGVNVQSGTDYHVVLSFANSGDSFNLRVDDGAPDGRSAHYASGTWATQSSFDYRMRAVVSSSTSPGKLPVELVGFDVHTDDERVVLNWQTAIERDNAGFDVQRRVIGSTESGTIQGVPMQQGSPLKGSPGGWQTIGHVEGAGTTHQPQSYRFADADLPYAADSLAYRLKQIDTDGTTSYSKEVAVRRTVDTFELRTPFPNPVHEQVTVRYAVPERQDVQLSVYDLLGRQVQAVSMEEEEGRKERQLNVSRLSSGVYFLRLTTQGESQTQKIIVVQ